MPVDEDGRPEQDMDSDGAPPPNSADLKFEPIEDLDTKMENGEPEVEKKEVEEKMDVDPVVAQAPKTPLEHVEEIMAILKTGYPLLALSMETMVDQILARLKPSPEEDLYRIVTALLTDGYQQLILRISTGSPGEKFMLSPVMRSNIDKLISSPYVQTTKVCWWKTH